MERNHGNKQGTLTSLIGAPSPAKASGLTYTLAALFSVVVGFVFLLLVSALGLAQEGYEKSDWYLYSAYLLTPLTFFLVAAFVLRWSNGSIAESAGVRVCSARYFILAILLQCGLLCLSQLNGLFLEWLEGYGYQDTPIELPSLDGFGLVGVLFTVAVLPAFFEELIFRGLLLKGMRVFGIAGAVLLNGALFALYHQNPAQTLYQFCCGAAFALVAIRAGSILPTVLSHFLNNALIIFLMKFNATEWSGGVTIAVLIVSVICLIASMVWLIFLDKGEKSVERTIETRVKRAEQKSFFLYVGVGVLLYALTWFSVLLTGF